MTVAPFTPGTKFARYEIVSELGRGAIGETFAARVMSGERQGELVCLKILGRQHLGQGARAGEREGAIRSLRHEARVVAGLDHPNIAQLFDSGVHEDRWYLALELVTGVNLAEAMACGPLGAPHVMHIGLELAKALACAHEHDVLHRDIKPSNILIGTEGEVKLIDFGLAKLHAGASAEFTRHVGTPRYSAPEQLRAEALSPATDIYSLGLVLFELLTGSHPFYSADADEFQRNILDGLPQGTLHGRGLPADLVSIVECCIQRDSSSRFINGLALQNAFAAAVERSLDDSLWDMRVVDPDPAAPVAGATPKAAARADDVPTRVGRLADRVADIRDEPADLAKGVPDFPTRFVEDPTAEYRRVTRAIAPAEMAAQVAKSMPLHAESIMGDLSRLARALTDQRSAGLEPAQLHRSGVRPVDEATPPGRRSRTTAYGYGDPAQARTEPSEQSPTAPQQDNTKVPGHPTNLVARPPRARWIGAGVVVALAAFATVLALAPDAFRSSEGKGAHSTAQPLRDQPGPSTSSAAARASASPPLEQPTDHAVQPAPPVAAEVAEPTAPEDVPSHDEQPAAADIAPSPLSTKGHSKARQAEAVDLVPVTIGIIPFGEVIVDGKPMGAAPVVVKLAPGKHRIVGRSRQLRRARTIEVNAETNLVVLDLRNVESSP